MISTMEKLTNSTSNKYTRKASFSNGTLIRSVDEFVLLEQAAESLKSALDLIEEASNKTSAWVDARNLLDQTAAALDDAGLALRRRPAMPKKLSKRRKLKIPDILKRKSTDPPSEISLTEASVRDLADQVIYKRRRLLGDMLVHDADGIWAKTMYGDCDGISFGSASDVLCRVPGDSKNEIPLIVWASQTGTAKKLAKHLHKSLGGDRHCIIRGMKDIGVRDLAKHKNVYIICSTFGIGRPPRNGEVFYSLVQLEAMRYQDNEEDIGDAEVEKPLEGTSFAIAALGSSDFEGFASFGFGLAKELVSLGASKALETTTHDDKNGKAKQKKSFQAWQAKAVALEDERRAGRPITSPHMRTFAPHAA
mmetsp:Transcript_21147/g.27832  ORF Transcript_21147/g.27832 Transcript_21147/m.27832 type:complete len:364 (-) Transcript_21147:256-1347(-)